MNERKIATEIIYKHKINYIVANNLIDEIALALSKAEARGRLVGLEEMKKQLLDLVLDDVPHQYQKRLLEVLK